MSKKEYDPFEGIPKHPDPDYMWISPSQDETMERCTRLWAFENVIRVPRPPKGDQDFGTIIHSVAERYQLADDLGRGEDGQPVNLYPDGWDTTQGRTIPVWQKALIPVLIDKAIEGGVLERPAGRRVEVWLSEDLIPGKVGMRGKADVLSPGEVQDHKSTGWMKYCKSDKPTTKNAKGVMVPNPKYLGSTRQMLDYGHFALEAGSDTVKLRHNIFLRDADKPQVRKIQATVTRAQVESNWSRLKKQAEEMLGIRTSLQHGLIDVMDIPGPNASDGCKQFGGCPMELVCSKVETTDQYIQRAKQQIKFGKENKPSQGKCQWGMFGDATNTKNKKDTMDIFAKATPINGAKAAVVPTEAAAPTEVAETITAVLEGPPAMPWYHAGCKACNGNAVPGISSNGNPCRMCDIKQTKAGLPKSTDFIFDADGNGNYLAIHKETEEITEVNVINAEVKATEKVEVPPAKDEKPIEEPKVRQRLSLDALKSDEDKSEPKAEPEPVDAKPVSKFDEALGIVQPGDAEAEADAEVETKPEPETKPRGGRPRVGYTLYMGCMPAGTKTVTAEYLFNQLASEFAVSQGVDSYYDLDPFKRKDAFGRIALELNERFAKLHIVARHATPGTDLGAFLAALRSACSPSRLVEALGS